MYLCFVITFTLFIWLYESVWPSFILIELWHMIQLHHREWFSLFITLNFLASCQPSTSQPPSHSMQETDYGPGDKRQKMYVIKFMILSSLPPYMFQWGMKVQICVTHIVYFYLRKSLFVSHKLSLGAWKSLWPQPQTPLLKFFCWIFC